MIENYKIYVHFIWANISILSNNLNFIVSTSLSGYYFTEKDVQYLNLFLFLKKHLLFLSTDSNLTFISARDYLSTKVCWPIVESLWKPLENSRIGNSRVGNLLGIGRWRDSFKLERIRAGFGGANGWFTIWAFVGKQFIGQWLRQGGNFLLWANVERQLVTSEKSFCATWVIQREWMREWFC